MSNTPEPRISPALEHYKARLGFWQAIWGTIISGGVAVAIPAAVDAYKAHLDLEKARQDIVLKGKEIEEKRQDQYQEYVSRFLSTALNQDIELRLRFAEYFSFVADTADSEKWRNFNSTLKSRKEEIRTRIEKNENLAARLVSSPKLDTDQQIELARLRRELAWDYAEIGYARQDTDVTAPGPSLSSVPDKNSVIADEGIRFSNAVVDASRSEEVKGIVDSMSSNQQRYAAVSQATGIPWHVIAIIHQLETGGDFSVHLNGDPLTARTVHPPRNRPSPGTPPFKWEDSAVDLIRASRLTESPDDYKSVGATLYRFETYNGLGYRRRGAASPYVWACTNQYSSGIYTVDNAFDPSATSRRCGAAAILKTALDRKITSIP